MWTCSKCGCENDDSNKFCSECGESIIDEASPERGGVAEGDGGVSADIDENGGNKTENPTTACGGPPPLSGEAQSSAEGDGEVSAAADDAADTAAEDLANQQALEQQRAEEEARKKAEEARRKSENRVNKANKKAVKAQKKAQKAAQKAADTAREEGMPLPPGGPAGDWGGKDASVFERILSPLAIILGIIGLFSGGYAAFISFINIGTALLFYIPSAAAVILGLLCLTIGANRGTKKVQVLAVIGIILGLVGIVAWLVITLMLRSRVITATGGTELIDLITILLKR